MKEFIVETLIVYCSKNALKYEQRITMLLNQKGMKYISAVGCNVLHRDKWLNRIIKLQNYIHN